MTVEKRPNPRAFRLTDSEEQVFQQFIDRIKKRNPYINESQIIREALFTGPTVNDLDRLWLREEIQRIQADDHTGRDAVALPFGSG